MKLPDRKGSAYRIIDVAVLIKMFKKKRIYFSSPLNWQDKWEKLEIELTNKNQTELFNQQRDKIYSQCWTKESYSWALWKMNSPNGHGVRLKTDLSKIYELMPSKIRKDYKMDDIIKRVEYIKEKDIEDRIKELSLKDKMLLNSVMKIFFLKRKAFTFEDEIRIIIPKTDKYRSLSYENIGNKRYLYYTCNPCMYISSIYFDSIIDQNVYDVFKKFFENCGFKGEIKKSSIDKKPKKKIISS